MSKTHVKVLREARAIIENGTKVFLCNALTFRKTDYSETEGVAASELVQLIAKRLGHSNSLEMWMRKHHPSLMPRVLTSYHTEQLRLTRLAWIDSLIEEFK